MVNEYLQKQLDEVKPLDIEVFNKLKSKTYYSGRTIQIGDILLFGFLQIGESKYDMDNKLINDYRVIAYNSDEIDVLYMIDDFVMSHKPDSKFLYLKLKE